MAGDPDILLRLPAAKRSAFKEPLGPVCTDVSALLDRAGNPLVTVGDVVTHHVLEAGVRPAVAVVDGRTHRGPTDTAVSESIGAVDWHRYSASNPPGTITAGAIRALAGALEQPDPAVVDIDGEEDLLAVVAIFLVPAGGTVVYGQPDEGMVPVRIGDATRERARSLLEHLDGDHDRAFELLDG